MAGWITINGTHVFVKEGESVEEAFSRTTGANLSTKSNPEQSNNAKKFSLKDVINKEREKRVDRNMEKFFDAKSDKDKVSEGKYQERASAADKEISESEKLTEKGAEARKAREAKAQEKQLDEESTLIAAEEDIKKDAAKGKRNPNFREDRYGEFFNENGIKSGKFDAYINALEKYGDDEKTLLKLEALNEKYKVNFDTLREFKDAAIDKGYTAKEALELVTKMSKDGSIFNSLADDIPEKGTNQTANDNIRAATGRGTPKLGAPEKGNDLSLGTYKGYSIDKDILGGKAVTVNAFGEELVFKSVEEAMKEIDKFKKK